MQANARTLTEGPITPTLLRFALPMMAGNLLQQLYNIADTLIVGRYVGADALAAVGSAYTLMTFLTSILLGLSMGSGVAVSISYGRGDGDRMRREIFLSLCMIGGAAVAPDQAPVLLATVVGIVATFVQIGLVFLKGRRPEPMLWISLAVIVVFGSLTLWLHNEMFIKWKPTILYWIFGSILLFGEFTRRNFLTMLLGKQLELPPSAWGVMQRAWIGFFYITGIINLIVAYAFSTETWVNFKLFGLLALTFIFTIAISVWVMKKTESLTK